VYVSTIDLYKHQWNVAEAVARLRKSGMPIELELVGSAYPPALRRLQEVTRRIDPDGQFIHYRGAEAYSNLPACYHRADLFVFASSCENMPNVLLEAMASGLPIACSKRGPMPDILGDAGDYFDPEQPEQIAQAMANLMGDTDRRRAAAEAAFERAQTYSWQRCADATLKFIVETTRAAGRVS